MTTVITRKRYHSLDTDKMCDQDNKCNNYVDTIADGDGPMELKTISEGSSGSSIAEMNNNTNGKVLTMGPQVSMTGKVLNMGSQVNMTGKVLTMGPHVNMNDNRQHVMEAPTVQGPDSATVMKKIKQIYMDEVPLHLSGLSLSGSGMELFVKLDQNLDKALRQASNAVAEKRGRKRKKMTKAKKFNEYLQVVNRVTDAPRGKERDMEGHHVGLDLGLREEGNMDQARQHRTGVASKRNVQMEEAMPDVTSPKDVDAVATQSKPSVTDRIRHLKVTPHSQQSYFPYGWNQNFQHQHQQPTQSANIQSNVISGPIWNVENGQIDVIRSQDTLPSTSNVQANPVANDTPIDYSLNPFPGGFRSNNLPLKRRVSPPRWTVQNVRRVGDSFDAIYQDDNTCQSNGFTRKERLRRVRAGKVRKMPLKKMAKRLPSTSQEEAIIAAEKAFLASQDVKQTSSEMSHGEQSSIGPQFQTDLLTPQTMDADTLIKFTEYTHDLRKDLKQKYKDLSKLLKAFEDTVQNKNNSTEEEVAGDAETEPQVGRCRIM